MISDDLTTLLCRDQSPRPVPRVHGTRRRCLFRTADSDYAAAAAAAVEEVPPTRPCAVTGPLGPVAEEPSRAREGARLDEVVEEAAVAIDPDSLAEAVAAAEGSDQSRLAPVVGAGGTAGRLVASCSSTEGAAAAAAAAAAVPSRWWCALLPQSLEGCGDDCDRVVEMVTCSRWRGPCPYLYLLLGHGRATLILICTEDATSTGILILILTWTCCSLSNRNGCLARDPGSDCGWASASPATLCVV